MYNTQNSIYDRNGYFSREFIMDQTLNDSEIEQIMVQFFDDMDRCQSIGIQESKKNVFWTRVSLIPCIVNLHPLTVSYISKNFCLFVFIEYNPTETRCSIKDTRHKQAPTQDKNPKVNFIFCLERKRERWWGPPCDMESIILSKVEINLK